MVSSGIPESLALEAAAALMLCSLNNKSMPASCSKIFTQGETVCFDTGPCGFIVLISSLSLFLKFFVLSIYKESVLTIHNYLSLVKALNSIKSKCFPGLVVV